MPTATSLSSASPSMHHRPGNDRQLMCGHAGSVTIDRGMLERRVYAPAAMRRRQPEAGREALPYERARAPHAHLRQQPAPGRGRPGTQATVARHAHARDRAQLAAAHLSMQRMAVLQVAAVKPSCKARPRLRTVPALTTDSLLPTLDLRVWAAAQHASPASGRPPCTDPRAGAWRLAPPPAALLCCTPACRATGGPPRPRLELVTRAALEGRVPRARRDQAQRARAALAARAQQLDAQALARRGALCTS